MRGANVGSWYAMPLRVIPERGQVSKNASKPPAAVSRKDCCDVLHDRVGRSNIPNESSILRPEAAPISLDSFSAPVDAGNADVLARESTADNVAFDVAKGSDIIEAGHVGPALLEDGTAVGLDLAEGDGAESPGAFEPEAESADAAEQVEDS
jgi:hypothetical protein